MFFFLLLITRYFGDGTGAHEETEYPLFSCPSLEGAFIHSLWLEVRKEPHAAC